MVPESNQEDLGKKINDQRNHAGIDNISFLTIHDPQAIIGALPVAELCVLLGQRVLGRVRVVDPVHLGRLDEHLCVDLGGSKCRGSVGGEEWVARAGAKDHNAAGVEVRDGAAADVPLGDLPHLNGGLDAGVDA